MHSLVRGYLLLAWVFCWKKKKKDMEGCFVMHVLDYLEGEK